MKRLLMCTLLCTMCLVLSSCTNLIRIEGQSMAPTLVEGDVVTTVPYASAEEIARFDLVICSFPGRDAYFSKRIVGLPGDRIAITGGYLYVNGTRYDEPYISDENRGRADFQETIVPQGCFFVLGDNRDNSLDSRVEAVGALPFSLIESQIDSIVWPSDRALPAAYQP